MIAKLEKPISKRESKTYICKYKNLNNLLHWHTETEIVIVLRGIVKIQINSDNYLMNQGMCAFLKSGDIHCINGSPDSITHIIKTSCDSVGDIVGNDRLKIPVFTSMPSVEKFFIKIESEIKNKKEYFGIIADSMTVQLIAEIFRTQEVCFDDISLDLNKDSKKLLGWISQNYAHICFEDAVKYTHFSTSYFSKYFQRLTGIKFTQYLNILKISAATDKILLGGKNMAEISIDCGFTTIRNFNRVFKNLTGYTPRSLPKNYKFPYIISDEKNQGFDPTLLSSEII